jgi:DNA-binding XRE family transcriptional regulator
MSNGFVQFLHLLHLTLYNMKLLKRPGKNPMSNIVSGRQLRAARVLAGLTQAQLARQAGFQERACRYWEARGDDPPTTVGSSLAKIEAALGRNGVVVFRDPTPGARLAPHRSCRLGHISTPIRARARTRVRGLSGWTGNDRVPRSNKKDPAGPRTTRSCCSRSNRAPSF